MTPVPFVSNRSKASLISFFCSSVSSNFGPDFFLDAVVAVAVDFLVGSDAFGAEKFHDFMKTAGIKHWSLNLPFRDLLAVGGIRRC